MTHYVCTEFDIIIARVTLCLGASPGGARNGYVVAPSDRHNVSLNSH